LYRAAKLRTELEARLTPQEMNAMQIQNRENSFVSQLLITTLIDNSLGYQATGYHGCRHPSAGMCARANKIQVVITRMPIGWPEVSHLR
jgi:hypothetical protein